MRILCYFTCWDEFNSVLDYVGQIMSAYTLTKPVDASSLRSQPDTALLDEVVHRIVRTIDPDKIVLFGSGGRGQMHSESDLDILVIAPSALPRHRRSVPLYLALSNILMPMDIVVYTPEEVEEWRNVRQAFVTTALREGKVLYERTACYQKGPSLPKNLYRQNNSSAE